MPQNKTLAKAVEKNLQDIAADGRAYLEKAYYAVLEGDGEQDNRNEVIALMSQADSALDTIQNTAALTLGLVDALTEDIRGAAKKAERLAEQLKQTAVENDDMRRQLMSARAEIRRLNEQIEVAVDSALQAGLTQGWESAQQYNQ